jgi:hypothetical protein
MTEQVSSAGADSNLGPDTDYPDLDFHSFPQLLFAYLSIYLICFNISYY